MNAIQAVRVQATAQFMTPGGLPGNDEGALPPKSPVNCATGANRQHVSCYAPVETTRRAARVRSQAISTATPPRHRMPVSTSQVTAGGAEAA